MLRIVVLIFFLASLCSAPIFAVSQNGNYITTQPTNSEVAHWTTGWPSTNVTGWNYLGQIGASGAVYLGNGWVLTAAHVGIGNFYLNGVYYNAITNTAQYFAVPGQPTEPVDLCLFQVSPPPDLPPLTISQSLPNLGNVIVMLGFGSPVDTLTWGAANATYTNYVPNPHVIVNGVTYYSTNIIANQATPTNSVLVADDSGGGDFVYNSSTQKWELTGINEFYGSYSNGTQLSGFVQLSTYASAITAAMANVSQGHDTPAMPIGALAAMACFLLAAGSVYLRNPQFNRDV